MGWGFSQLRWLGGGRADTGPRLAKARQEQRGVEDEPGGPLEPVPSCGDPPLHVFPPFRLHIDEAATPPTDPEGRGKLDGQPGQQGQLLHHMFRLLKRCKLR